MNTGHTTFSTFHAGNIASAVHRLRNEPLNVPLTLLESLDIVISQRTCLDETGCPIRRCIEIAEIIEKNDIESPHINKSESLHIRTVYLAGIPQNDSRVFPPSCITELHAREDALRRMLPRPDYQSFIAALKEFYG